MLNVRSVEKFVVQRFPNDVVRVQYFEVRQRPPGSSQGVLWPTSHNSW